MEHSTLSRFIFDEWAARKELVIKQVYKMATGNDLTVDNVKEVALLRQENWINKEAISICGTVVGMIETKLEGSTVTITFEPDDKYKRNV